MYKITCTDYNNSYVGETGRTLNNERLKENKRALRLSNPSHLALAEHALNTGRNIGRDDALVDFESKFWSKKVKESIWIKRIKPTLIMDSGYLLSPIFGPVIARQQAALKKRVTDHLA